MVEKAEGEIEVPARCTIPQHPSLCVLYFFLYIKDNLIITEEGTHTFFLFSVLLSLFSSIFFFLMSFMFSMDFPVLV